MKKSVKKIFEYLSVFWSMLYSPKLAARVRGFGNFMYSHWIGRAFGSVGERFIIERPFYLLGGENIFIGDNFSTRPGLRIETYTEYLGKKFLPKLTIGNNVAMNFDCHIGCIERVDIGNNVLIASRVFITDHFHGTTNGRAELLIPPSLRLLSTKGAVVIEDDVWLGEGVAVMPGVRIGRGAVVGANAVVTKDVSPYSIVGGIPARIIKQL